MQLTGLIAAPHTLLHTDHSLNTDAVAPLAAHLAANGVNGVFVAGTTGECQSLTPRSEANYFKLGARLPG